MVGKLTHGGLEDARSVQPNKIRVIAFRVGFRQVNLLDPPTIVWVWFQFPVGIQARRASGDVAQACVYCLCRWNGIIALIKGEEHAVTDGFPRQIVVTIPFAGFPVNWPSGIVENQIRRTESDVRIDQRTSADAARPSDADSVIGPAKQAPKPLRAQSGHFIQSI